jgi:hypothetical protein
MFSLMHVLAFAVWVPVGVWIYTVIGWLVMDDVEPVAGLIALGVGVSLGVSGSFAPDRSYAWLPFSIALITVVLYPIVNESWRRHELFKIELERVGDIYERLGGNRSDVYGKATLALMLYDRGLVQAAAALMDGALKGQPKDLFQNEFKALARWQHELGGVPLRTVTQCLRCGAENASSDCFCRRCGARYLMDLFERRYVGFRGWAMLLVVWGVLAGCVAAAPFVVSDNVSTEVRLGVGIGAVVVALAGFGFFVVKGVRG